MTKIIKTVVCLALFAGLFGVLSYRQAQIQKVVDRTKAKTAEKEDSGCGGCSDPDNAELQAAKKAYFAKWAKRQKDGTYIVERESVSGAKITLTTNDKGQCVTDHPCASTDRTCKRCSNWRNGCSGVVDMCCCLPYGSPPRRDRCKCKKPKDPKGPPAR